MSRNKRIDDENKGLGLTSRTDPPKWVYIALFAMYLVTSISLSMFSRSKEVLMINGAAVPYSSFTGVLSSFANICIIMLVAYFRKLGFITSLILLLSQFPMLFLSVFIRHSYASISGFFTNFLFIVTAIMLYARNKRVADYQEQITKQATTDILTGLPNRFACSQLVKQLMKRREMFTVVAVDINGFKSINDTMGFNAGNKALSIIAERWKALADREDAETRDFICRAGGDEFVILIRGASSSDDVLSAIKRYENALLDHITIDDCDLYISASFGYANYPADGKTSDMLFNRANAAMGEVKRINSSDHIMAYTTDILRSERTLEIETKLRAALENDTMTYALQPQYDIDHKLRGFEALARMKNENGSFISPGEFIPVAEKVGLIDKIDIAVFRKASAFFGDLLRTYGLDITLSVNVSVRHLMKNDFLSEVKEIIDQSGVPIDCFEIEITESIMIDSAEKALRVINDLRDMGVQIAIDDFGTGYSSLSYLNNFPAHLLKIDKSFIDKMNTSGPSKQYVAAIISIGHILGFDVISEGVEEQEQLDTLKDIGCDYIQGYIWGKPLPAEDAEKLVKSMTSK